MPDYATWILALKPPVAGQIYLRDDDSGLPFDNMLLPASPLYHVWVY